MSSRSRRSSRPQSSSNNASSVNQSSDIYQTYLAAYASKDKDESLFDDDDDLRSKYMEKEQALKKINEELEKKSREIFNKIERIRTSENSYIDKNVYEIGQGDAPAFDLPRISTANSRLEEIRSESRTESLRSPQSLSRSTYNRFTYPSNNNDVDEDSQDMDLSFSLSRPVTTSTLSTVANGSLSSPDLYLSNSPLLGSTPQLARRPETAKPIVEGLEGKSQARLQKATESVLKCVQSKLVNYEQRMADMHLQYRQKIQENTMLESKVKALEEDRKRLLKTVQTLQSTTDKYSKHVESSKMNLNLKAQAFGSLKKEMDGLKRDLKQKCGMIQSLQTRLDRCTEENRRLKSQHQSTHLNLKQQHNEDRAAMDELKQRILQLEQQKSSFQSTVEKQAQLIKNLRTQKTYPMTDRSFY